MLRTAAFLVCVLCTCAQSPSFAVNFGAVTDGDWSNPATWTPAGGPPSNGDVVNIGSNSPAGSAAMAAVSLTGNESATSLFLGGSPGTEGTLDLGSFELALSSALVIGTGVGNVTRTTGHFEVPDLTLLGGNSLTLSADDSITHGVQVTGTSSQLTLGAPMMLSLDLSIQNDGTVDLANQDLSVRNLFLGWSGVGFNLLNDAAINVSATTFIRGTDYTFDADDSITDLYLNDATATLDPATEVRNLVIQNGGMLTTVSETSVTASAAVDGATSQLTLVAPLTLSSDLNISNDGTVDLANQPLSVRNLFLGWSGVGFNLLNDAAINVSATTFIRGTDYTFDADDSITDLYLNDATATLDPATEVRNLVIQNGGMLTTVSETSVTASAAVDGATSQLTLVAPLTLSSDLNISNDGTVDLANQDLSVRNLFLGWSGVGYNLLNDAAINVSATTFIRGTDYTFDADDSITDLYLNDATATLDPATEVRNLVIQNGGMLTTVSETSVTASAAVDGATSQLTLVAPLTLSSDLNISNDGTVDLANQPLSVRNLFLGWSGVGFNLINDAAINVSATTFIRGTDYTFDADDSITDLYLNDATATLDPATEVRNLVIQNGGMLTTVSETSVTASAAVDGATSQLTLVAPLTLSSDLNISNDGTVDLANQPLSVRNLFLGWNGVGFNLLNDGAINVSAGTFIRGTDYSFDADDVITDLYVNNATVTLDAATEVRNLVIQNGGMLTTVSETSVTASAAVDGAASQLTLAAPMTLSGDVAVTNDGTVDLANQDIHIRNLFLGWTSGVGNLTNDGLLHVTASAFMRRSAATFSGEQDRIEQDLIMNLGSSLTYELDLNAPFGLYVGGNTLDIDGSSQLVLDFENNPAAFYSSVFRWKNPVGGNRFAELQALIDSGRIVIDSSDAANVVLFLGIDGTTNIGYFNDLPGDYDRNGVIDEADFDKWKLDFGSTVPNPGEGSDGNFDGIVNIADYTIWRNHLGQSNLPIPLTQAIPEPSCLAMLVGMLAAVGLAHRARHGARYEINTFRPLFCGRDGKVKYSLAEIDQDRRTGYAWYVRSPESVYRVYDNWKLRGTPAKSP
ncbi:pectate lyase [Aeoliella sp.]|uniref:beta strand repeat-containing protein n=1 Tax=Aeoliella sp. TaxID=2795800 RepID=UPI003CCBFCDA